MEIRRYAHKYNVLNLISHLKNTVMTFEINMTRQLEPKTNWMTYLLSSKIPAIGQTNGGEPKKGHARNF